MGSLGFVAPFMLCVAHSALHLRDLGVAPSTASTALGLLTAFSIVGRLGAGFLGDRIEPRLLWSVSLFLMAGGCLAIIQAEAIAVVVLYTILVGVGFGGAYVCRTITIGNYFGTKAFASINGILGSVLTVFAAAAPWLGGLARDALGSYNLVFVLTGILSILGSLCLLVAKEPKGSRAANSG
jgi:MFS family permease